MRTVGLAEAKAQLSALLDAVEAGDEVLITRRGQAVAKLVRSTHPISQQEPSTWAERFRQLHASHPAPKRTAVEMVREIRDEE